MQLVGYTNQSYSTEVQYIYLLSNETTLVDGSLQFFHSNHAMLTKQILLNHCMNLFVAFIRLYVPSTCGTIVLLGVVEPGNEIE